MVKLLVFDNEQIVIYRTSLYGKSNTIYVVLAQQHPLNKIANLTTA